MEKTWSVIKTFLSENVIKLVCSALTLADKIFDYFRNAKKAEAAEKADAEVKKAEREIDDACDKGGIDDLFDAAEKLKNARRKKKEAGR